MTPAEAIAIKKTKILSDKDKMSCLGCGKLITPNRVQCRACCIDMFGTPNEPK